MITQIYIPLFLLYKEFTSLRIKTPVSLKAILWLLLLLLCCKDLQAQSYIADVRRLSVEDGLSNRFVRSIFKDSRGFMWIGTQYGLNRYDGYEFKHYTKENSGLTNNMIHNIYEDDRQNLWLTRFIVGKGIAIDVLNSQTGHIQNFDTLFKTLAPFKAKSVIHIYADIEKTLWFTTETGQLYRYKNQRFEESATIPLSEKDQIGILHIDKGFAWLFHKSAWTGVLNNPTTRVIGINLKTGTAKTFSFPQGLKVVGMDDTHTLWMFRSEEKTFFRVHWEAQLLQRDTALPPELPGFASAISWSSRNHLNTTGNFMWWLSILENGDSFPVAWNIRENISYDFRDDIAPLLTYRDVPHIHNVCLDAENRLWLATEDGIFILSLKKNKFTTVIAPKGENYNVRSIIEDNNGVFYVKTYEGMLQIHPEKGVQKANSIPDGIAIVKDRQGKLWFGGGNSVEQYDPVSGKKQYYGPKPDEHIPELVMLMLDAIGRIWMGTLQGLYTLNPETGRFREFTRYNTFTELRESVIYHFQETGEGIWIGASSGLYFLEYGKGITTRYSSEQAVPYSIPHSYILHFYRDTEGLFWLATEGGGLIRFDPATGNARQFTTADGLSNTTIYAVYEDDYGKLWLPGNYGLMQFDKKRYRVTTWLKGDGIAHNEFNTGAHYRTSDGRFYFGSLAGLTSFHPKDFTAETSLPTPLRITRCQVLDGKTGQLTDKTLATINTGTLELSPSDKSLLIDFALLNYKNIQTNTYAYKIEGLDTDWTPIRTNSLRINALPYGKYVLHIKGRGIGGEQSANILTIDLRVNKPFYLKSGFILSVVLALILLIYGIFRWRLQRLKQSELRLKTIVRERTREIQQQKDEIESDKNTIEQQAVKLRELDSAKSRFFANISHELRTPLTLILGHLQATLREKYGKIGQQIRRNLEVSHSNSRRLLSMIEEILMLSKMEAGKLELHNKPVNLYRLIDRLCESFRPYIEGKHIRYSRHIALAKDSIVLLDEKKFEKIVSNLLSNAIKFTQAGDRISVSATEITTVKGATNQQPLVKLTVRDSGRGIHPKDLPRIFDRFYQGGDKDTPIEGGTGIGLALSKELAELLGGSLSAESHLGQGSVFTLAFPKAETSVLPGEENITKTDHPMFPKVLPENQNNSPSTIRRGHPPVLLLVEDHPEMRSFIRRQVAEDYRVLEAADGVEALEVLKKHRIDLILSDVMMPRMDGFQLLSALRSDPVRETIPVIMLTARAAREDRLHALTIGVDDYLTKPFDEEELMARIRYSLRNAFKRQRWSARLPEEEKEAVTADRQFLTKAEAIVIKALSDHQYSVIDMAEGLNLSQRQLSRRIRAATGLSPLQFIREIRLQKARILLEGREKETVAEVMYAVGFQKSDYFARVYRKRFGRLPSTYFS